MSIREKYAQRAAEATGLSSQIKDAETDMSHGGKKNNWLKIEEGFTDFRFLPSTVDGVNFMLLKKSYRLPIEVENQDGTKEIKDRKMVFDSVTHGGTPKDVVAEFLRIFDEEALETVRALNLPKAQFGPAIKAEKKVVEDYQTGIKPEFKWTGYGGIVTWTPEGAVKNIDKGVFDFAFSIGKKMDGLAAAQDRRGKVTTTNPFVSIDEGAILVVDYSKKRDPNEMYRVSLDVSVPVPWSDEQLQWLEEQPTLQEKYIGCYRRKDFNMACEGLKRFDERNSLGIFARPEFQIIIKEISGYYPEDEMEPMIIREGSKAEANKAEKADPFEGAELKTEKKAITPKRIPAKKAVLKEKVLEKVREKATPPVEEAPATRRRRQAAAPAEAEADQFTAMERSQLVGYIQFKALDITVTKEMSADDLRDYIRTEEELMLQEQHSEASDTSTDQDTSNSDGGTENIDNAF